MNAVTLRKALEVAGITPEKFYREEFDVDIFRKQFGESQQVECPRSTSSESLVVHFKDHNVFLKAAESSYSSYGGVEFDSDDWVICEEKEKTIKVYNAVRIHVDINNPESIIDSLMVASIEQAFEKEKDDDSYDSSYDR